MKPRKLVSNPGCELTDLGISDKFLHFLKYQFIYLQKGISNDYDCIELFYYME
jgi:hypothetical protein